MEDTMERVVYSVYNLLRCQFLLPSRTDYGAGELLPISTPWLSPAPVN